MRNFFIFLFVALSGARVSGDVTTVNAGTLNFGAVLTSGESLYVRPQGGTYGTEDGSSWTNAFDGFSDVVWGGGTGQVGAGDTLFVGTGTYTQDLSIGAEGTSNTNRVTVRAAQDAQTGTVNINGTILFNGNDWITIDGLLAGVARFNNNNGIDMQNLLGPKVSGMVKNGGVLACQFGQGQLEISYCTFNMQPDDLWFVNGEGNADPEFFGLNSIHHCSFTVPSKTVDGTGGDCVKTGYGWDVYNNVFQAFEGTVTNGEHQDLIQVYGHFWTRIFNNTFIDSSDSQVGMSAGGTLHDFQIFNNVFIRTVVQGTSMFRMYGYPAGQPINTIENVHIDNNTFVDGARMQSVYGPAMSFGNGAGSQTVTGSTLQNNIFYNCGRDQPVLLLEGYAQTGWVVSNNLINAGSAGNNSFPWTNTNGQSGAPAFVGYTAYSLSNNLHLAAGDTAAKERGVSLAPRFTTDKDGLSRPRGTLWDIGAYEF